MPEIRGAEIGRFSPPALLHHLRDSNVGQALAQGVALLRMVVLARLVGPQPVGAFAALLLVVTYGAVADFGALNGMNRRMPMLRARGDVTQAKAVRDSTFTATMAVAFGLGGVVAIVALLGPWGMAAETRVGLGLMGFAIAVYEVFNFQVALARINHRFDLHRDSVVIRAVVELVVGLALVKGLGAIGLVTAFVTGMLVSSAYIHLRLADRFQLHLQWDVLWTTMVEGFPIFLTSIAMTILTSLDRLLLATFGDQVLLGFHALALQFGTIALFIPAYACMVLYVRFLDRLGRPGAVIADLQGDVDRALAAFGLAIPFVIGSLSSATWLVPHLFPAYADSLPVLQATILCQAPLAFAILPAAVLTAAGRAMLVVAWQAAAGIAVLAIGILVAPSAGVPGILATVAAGFTAYSLGVTMNASRLMGTRTLALRGWVSLLAIIGAVLLAALGHERLQVPAWQAATVVAGTTAAIAFVQAWRLERQTGWIRRGFLYARALLRKG